MTVGQALVGLGGGLGIAGSIFGGSSAKRASKEQARAIRLTAQFESAVAEDNALFYEELGERNARAIRLAGRASEQRFRRDRRRAMAQTVANMAAAGVGISGVSAVDIVADEAAESEESALLIRFGVDEAVQQARLASLVQARNERLRGIAALFGAGLQADVVTEQGRGAQIAGFLGAGQGLLTTGLALL